MSILDGIQPGNRIISVNGVRPAQARDRLEIEALGAGIADDPSGQRTIVTLPDPGGGATTAWTQFIPTITAAGGGFSLGNGTLDAWYRQTGPDTAEMAFALQLGSTTSLGTGALHIQAPPIGILRTASMAIGDIGMSTVYLLDSSTPANNKGGKVVVNDTTSVAIVPYGTATPVDHLTPFTWATGDEIRFAMIVPMVGV